ncbi:Anamorsin-B [Cucumispora dikerogammari]|nr:Anamorsin-B [Cucumispora dikerogammari]
MSSNTSDNNNTNEYNNTSDNNNNSIDNTNESLLDEINDEYSKDLNDNNSSEDLNEEMIQEILNKAIQKRTDLDPSFLTIEDTIRPQNTPTISGEIKRRPCDNCSCGLKPQIDINNKNIEINNKTKVSNCGSCYLGDAFRCGGCPFLGKPAFEPGSEAFFDSEDLN